MGAGIGKLIWTGWEYFRNRFLLMSKEDKKKLKELKGEKRKLKDELKQIKKLYKECRQRYEQMPLIIVQNEYMIIYDMFANHEKGLTKMDIIRLECSGKTLVKRMNLSNEITPKELYEMIYKKFKEEGE